MESKTLKGILTVVKIAKILSLLLFIASIVGAAACLGGSIMLFVVGEDMIKFGSFNLLEFVNRYVTIDTKAMSLIMLSGCITCIGEIFVSKLAHSHFKHTLAEGEIFTFKGAKEMLRLGIIATVVPLGTTIISAIITAIAYPGVNGELPDLGVAWFGVAFIFISLILKYGAEKISE